MIFGKPKIVKVQRSPYLPVLALCAFFFIKLRIYF